MIAVNIIWIITNVCNREDDDAGGKDEEVGEPAEVVPLLVVVDVKRVVLSRVGVEFRQLPKLGLQGAAVPGIKC